MRTRRIRLSVSLGWSAAAVAVAVVAAMPVVWTTRAEAARPQRGPGRQMQPVPDDVELLKDVAYGKGGGRPLKLDILRPKKRPATPMPVLVYVHGGAWRAGSKEMRRPQFFQLAQAGYFVASIEYRLSREAIFPAQIEDTKCAIRFLRAHAKDYRINTDRIGVWGHSAGGHLVALLGTAGDVKDLEGQGGWADQSSRVQAVVDCFGPTNFLKMTEGLKALGMPDRMNHDSANSPESQLIGGAIHENRQKVARADPITYVSKDDPPFLILHGDRDSTVPPNQSQLLYDALKKAGVDATLHFVKGAGHGFRDREADEMMWAFFDRHVKGTK